MGQIYCFSLDVSNFESNNTTDYDVKSGPNVNAIWGDDAELVCTASSPLDLEYPPTMTWYKKNDEGDDKYLPVSEHI